MCRYAHRSQAERDILPKIGCAGQSSSRPRAIRSRSASSPATSARNRPASCRRTPDRSPGASRSRPATAAAHTARSTSPRVRCSGPVAWLTGFSPEGHAERVAQVADHLVRRHPAPPRGLSGCTRREPARDLRPALVCETSSSSGAFPTSRLRRPREMRRAPARPASASSTSARKAGSLRSASNCGAARSVGATK